MCLSSPLPVSPGLLWSVTREPISGDASLVDICTGSEFLISRQKKMRIGMPINCDFSKESATPFFGLSGAESCDLGRCHIIICPLQTVGSSSGSSPPLEIG